MSYVITYSHHTNLKTPQRSVKGLRFVSGDPAKRCMKQSSHSSRLLQYQIRILFSTRIIQKRITLWRSSKCLCFVAGDTPLASRLGYASTEHSSHSFVLPEYEIPMSLHTVIIQSKTPCRSSECLDIIGAPIELLTLREAKHNR